MGRPSETWAPGKAVPDLNFPHKNCLAHILHAPKKGDLGNTCKSGFEKAAKLVNPETRAKAQLTSNGKPATEWLNRLDVAQSSTAAAAEMLQALITQRGSPDGVLGPALAKLLQPAFDAAELARAAEVLNPEDYPGATVSKEDYDLSSERLVRMMGALQSKWAELSEVTLVAHNLNVAMITLQTGIAMVCNPLQMASDFANDKAQPTEQWNKWKSTPAHGPSFVKLLGHAAWLGAAEKRHAAGAPRGEEANAGGGGGLSWGSPRAAPPAAAGAQQEAPGAAAPGGAVSAVAAAIEAANALATQDIWGALDYATVTERKASELRELIPKLAKTKEELRSAAKKTPAAERASHLPTVKTLVGGLSQLQEKAKRLDSLKIARDDSEAEDLDGLLATPRGKKGEEAQVDAILETPPAARARGSPSQAASPAARAGASPAAEAAASATPSAGAAGAAGGAKSADEALREAVEELCGAELPDVLDETSLEEQRQSVKDLRGRATAMREDASYSDAADVIDDLLAKLRQRGKEIRKMSVRSSAAADEGAEGETTLAAPTKPKKEKRAKTTEPEAAQAAEARPGKRARRAAR